MIGETVVAEIVRTGLTDAEVQDVCGDDPGLLCRATARLSDSELLVRVVDIAVGRPLTLLVIILVAFTLSRLIRPLIGRIGGRAARRSARELAQVQRRAARGQADPPTNGRAELRAATVVSVVSSLSTVVIWTIAGMMIIGQFNIDLAPLFASAGVVGIALGFGAQSVVADFLSGFFMLFEDQYGVGDVIDVGEVVGAVEEFSLRTTTLRDVNGTVWHVPNSEIRRVGNKSQVWSRAVLDIDVAYDTDLRRAEGIIQRVADELWEDEGFTDGDIIDPPEVWGIEQLGADGISIRLVVKTDPAEQWIVARELRLRIKEAFDEAGIEIPFPQRTVWLRHEQTPAPPGERPEVEVRPIRLPDASEEMVENPGS